MRGWGEFNRWDRADDMYLPRRGQGDTMATQIVTAVTKLVYKWYNDGDVYDNTHKMRGWCNDLSSYANWLVKYTDRANVLYKICYISDDSEYEDLLKELTDSTHDERYLMEMNKREKAGSIYNCNGLFRFEEESEEDDCDLYL